METKPEKEHEWLQQLVGEWTFETKAKMGPDQPDETFRGKETVRSIGGLWIAAEGRAEMPGGGEGTMILTLGYDLQKKRFVGTWFGSMMTYLWNYDGSLDTATNTLTLNTDGPDFAAGEGKMAKYQETIELKSKDLRLFRSALLGPDGQWVTLVTGTYKRVK